MSYCHICHGLGWVPQWGPVEPEDLGLLLTLQEFYRLVGEPLVHRECRCKEDDDGQ